VVQFAGSQVRDGMKNGNVRGLMEELEADPALGLGQTLAS